MPDKPPRPVRLRLSRHKGFNLQAWSRELNGLEAVNCARPGRYGNPFVVSEAPSIAYAAYCTARVETADQAAALYRRLLVKNLRQHDDTVDGLIELRGKNLACWCALGAPCHADVLLELANLPVCEAAP